MNLVERLADLLEKQDSMTEEEYEQEKRILLEDAGQIEEVLEVFRRILKELG